MDFSKFIVPATYLCASLRCLDCENLVRRMLVINPKKRLTITQIKKHNWMQECVRIGASFLFITEVVNKTLSP